MTGAKHACARGHNREFDEGSRDLEGGHCGKERILRPNVGLLGENWIRYCVVGHAVNAYAEPVVSLDLDLVVATDQRASIERVQAASF